MNHKHYCPMCLERDNLTIAAIPDCRYPATCESSEINMCREHQKEVSAFERNPFMAGIPVVVWES